MTGELRGAAYRGGRWGVVSSVVQQLGSIGATLILARWLTPAEFGIVAVTQSVIGLSMLVTDAGLGASIVARDEPGERELSSLFWVSLAAGAAACVMIAGLSRPVASALGVEQASTYLQVAALTLITTMGQVVPRALLSRRLRFDAMYAIDVIGSLVYFAVEVLLVLTTDLGAWAVILGLAAMDALKFVLTVTFARWRPGLTCELVLVRPHVRFGLGYLGSTLTGYGAKNLDTWSVGRSLGAPALGAYYVAFVLPNVVRQRFTIVVNQVVFPVMARMTGPEQLRSAFVEVTQLVAVATVPVLVGLALVAEPVIGVFFGSQWSASVGPLRVLALAAAVDSLSALGQPVLLARSRTGLVFRANLVRLVALALALAVSLAMGFGLTGVGVAVLVSSLAAFVVSGAAVVTLVGLQLSDARELIVPVAIPAVVMVAAVVAVNRLLPSDRVAIVELMVSVGVGAAAYLGCGFLGFRRTYRRLTAEVRRFVTDR